MINLVLEFWPKLLNGLIVTCELVGLSIILGSPLALILALLRVHGDALVRHLASLYCFALRGTPLLAQLFLVYYGAGQFRPSLEALGLWQFFRSPFICTVFAFTLNTAAYQAEILYGALRSIAPGQEEAGRMLGLGAVTRLLHLRLPQALIVALRPLGNEYVMVMKASALASVVTVYDLMGETRQIFAKTFDIGIYVIAALIYLVVVELFRRFWSLIEQRMTRHIGNVSVSAVRDVRMVSGTARAV